MKFLEEPESTRAVSVLFPNWRTTVGDCDEALQVTFLEETEDFAGGLTW